MRENIYCLYHGPDDSPTIFYIGKCVGPVADRFAAHLRGIRNPRLAKEAYEYARHIGADNIKVCHLGTTDDGSEADFIEQATKEGHRLYNSVAGNHHVAKRPTRSSFKRLNDEALKRVEAVERRTILHGPNQNLSKSEVVAARLLETLPTLEQLQSAIWVPCAPEYLGTVVARTATRAELCKWGDLNIYIAWRRNDKDQAMLARNTRTGKEVRPELPTWWSAKSRDVTLSTLVRIMIVDWYWEKITSPKHTKPL